MLLFVDPNFGMPILMGLVISGVPSADKYGSLGFGPRGVSDPAEQPACVGIEYMYCPSA